MIVRQVSDVMDAEELAQDTFIRAFSHIDHYDPQKASLSTWLCRIAYRLDISDEQLESELSTGREERIQRLQETIDELPDEERLLLTLYYFEDRPLTEIAYITGIEPGPLANRLYRTRKKLLRRLKIEN